MKFALTMSEIYYSVAQVDKYKRLGFEFVAPKPMLPTIPGRPWWIMEKAVEIELTTLEELMAFVQEWGAIVLSPGKIEIYNQYRE